MRRKAVAAAAAAALLCARRPTLAQPAPPRIGFLSGFARADAEQLYGLLREELDKLGWTDGRNLVLLPLKTPEGRNEQLPAMAAALVAEAPRLVLAQSLPATRALMQATTSIPLVMIGVGSPVEYGVVADYRNPGGNVTGSKYPAEEAGSKLLQLLKEAAPRVRSVAVFGNPSNEAAAPFFRQMRSDAAALGMQALVVEVRSPGDFDAAFAAIRRAEAESILLPPEPLILAHREAIGSFAFGRGLPLAVVGVAGALPAGGLIAFGPTRQEFAKISARYVDRILKGARPAELPIEQPSRFEPTIDTKPAKALGLSIPPALLLRVDRLIP